MATAQAYWLAPPTFNSQPSTFTKLIYSMWFSPYYPTVYTKGTPGYMCGELSVSFPFTQGTAPPRVFNDVDFTTGLAVSGHYNVGGIQYQPSFRNTSVVVVLTQLYGNSSNFVLQSDDYLDTVSSPVNRATWNHFIIAIDGDTGNFSYALNGQSAGDNYGDTFVFPLEVARILLGRQLECCVKEVYMNTAEYLDLTDPDNLLKFYNNDEPADLGTDGSAPTGSTPLVYLPMNPDSPGTNAAGTGDFVVLYTDGVSVTTGCS